MMVDVGMLDCQVAILENAIGRYLADGEVPKPLGARHPSITPFEAFRARDGFLILAAGNQALFEKLSHALGRPDLAQDPVFATNDLRTRNHARLKTEIEHTLAQRDVEDWLAIVDTAGVPCGPINNVADVVHDDHVLARNMIVRSKDPVAGEVRMAGNPIKLSAYDDPRERAAAPELDGDREEVLRLAQTLPTGSGNPC
jgi:CoA:oxalate CoA-transferase